MEQNQTKRETRENAHGCVHCAAIFTVAVHSIENPFGVYHCPNCGNRTVNLGPLPCISKEGDEYYLVDDTGNCLGGYPSAWAANDNLWIWFGERHGFKEDYEESNKESRKGLKVIEGGRRDDLIAGGEVVGGNEQEPEVSRQSPSQDGV